MFDIAQAFAQETAITDAGATGIAGGLGSFAPLVLIFAVFYFLLIRPQQKRMKEHNAMVSGLARGDKVITAGGIYATVTKVEDDSGILHLEIAPEVKIRVKRDTVTGIVPAPSAVAANDSKKKDIKKETKKA